MTTETTQENGQPASLRSGPWLGGLVNVEEARKLYGEPEYGYFKQWMQWSPGARRGQAGHYAGSWVECPQDEFEREYDTGRTLEMRRFMKGSNTKDGVRNSYWLYERRLKTPGWVQKLIEELKALEKQATSSPNIASEPRPLGKNSKTPRHYGKPQNEIEASDGGRWL